ncbi:PrsW family intramembrane metalloprotease [Lentzea kentuckyensis]|uniref:PrsW family intramembrane metalloprotease n=1 Tax=Lentzea kentuckyensis TaxID=360086 RepID=UPI000A36E67E|nr:PrsW family glutamic-type intramembrane protease [Lentzea kentuckyensis]
MVMPTAPRTRKSWLRMFLMGLALWLATVAITYITENANLIPTIVLLGSFLVPATFVVWAFERGHSGEVTGEIVFRTFAVGGVLGVLGASLLETYLLHPSPWLFVGVGLIEEAVKLAALALLSRHLMHKSTRDGLVLGASVGFGFAAFESAGYALTATLTENGLSLMDLVTTELLRGLLAPFGHGLWTAILGGVLFSRSVREHFMLTRRLLWAYLGVSLLHALWDSMNSIAVVVTVVVTGEPWQEHARLFAVLTWLGLALISVVGVGWLVGLVRVSRREFAPVRGYPLRTDAPWWPAGRPPQ